MQIEQSPPSYLMASIGAPPRVDSKTGGHELRREWRRLALEIEDYRVSRDITDRSSPFGAAADPGRDVLERRVADYARLRHHGRGISR
jgi:hypothetical protein